MTSLSLNVIVDGGYVWSHTHGNVTLLETVQSFAPARSIASITLVDSTPLHDSFRKHWHDRAYVDEINLCVVKLDHTKDEEILEESDVIPMIVSAIVGMKASPTYPIVVLSNHPSFYHVLPMIAQHNCRAELWRFGRTPYSSETHVQKY